MIQHRIHKSSPPVPILNQANSVHIIPSQLQKFHCFGFLSKESVQVQGSMKFFVTNLFFYNEGLLAPRPTPKLEDHPLSFFRGCLFIIFATNFQSLRPFLRLQPKDTPCRGNMEPT
jgi:hypothetical protein